MDTRVKTVDWYLREGDRVEISELKDATGFSFENRRWTIGILIEESGRVVLLELKDASGFIGVEGRERFLLKIEGGQLVFDIYIPCC